MKGLNAVRFGALVLALMVPAASVQAIPTLQIYIEGATYDDLSDTWITESSGSLRLWAVGNVGAVGRIDDVKLSIAYASGLTPSFTLTGSTAGGYNGFTDPSTASDPVFNQTVTDGTAPMLGGGTYLPSHGIYGAATDWTEFKLGDFTLTDSYIADFNGSTDSPVPHASQMGQINVYDIGIGGAPEGTAFHFDLYDHYYNQNENIMYVKAPFSHDGGTTTVPEPGTLALVGLGAAGLAARLRARVRK